MELVKNLGYVKMEENNLSKERLLDELKDAVKELTSIQKGKIKARPINALLDKL